VRGFFYSKDKPNNRVDNINPVKTKGGNNPSYKVYNINLITDGNIVTFGTNQHSGLDNVNSSSDKVGNTKIINNDGRFKPSNVDNINIGNKGDEETGRFISTDVRNTKFGSDRKSEEYQVGNKNNSTKDKVSGNNVTTDNVIGFRGNKATDNIIGFYGDNPSYKLNRLKKKEIGSNQHSKEEGTNCPPLKTA